MGHSSQAVRSGRVDRTSHAVTEGVEKGRLGPRIFGRRSYQVLRVEWWQEEPRTVLTWAVKRNKMLSPEMRKVARTTDWSEKTRIGLSFLNLKCRLAVRVRRWDEVGGWYQQVWRCWRREAVLGQRRRFGVFGFHLMTDNWDWVRSTSPWPTQVWTRQRAEPLLQEGVSVSRTLRVSRERTRRKGDSIVAVSRSRKRKW